jgi:Rrf2 family nitric oxide-sensitive transcriptional repressor
MRLTQFTDYSLRLLLYLAERPDELCTVGDIALWYGVSKPHMAKIAHNLTKLGYVDGVQGKSGGLRLAKFPGDINIGKIIRQMEPDFHIVECFDKDRGDCKIDGACHLKHALHAATQAFFDVLDKHTLKAVSTHH